MQEHRLATPHGQLYARSWPSGDPAGESRAPIILFHDSLGCVALWRDFPAALAEATGHTVVAYDRFGFGQSAPHPGGWSINFIQDEARLYFPLLRDAQASFAQPGQVERLAKYHGEQARWVLHAWIDTWLSKEFSGWRIEQSAPAIRCPLLVLHGDRDEYGSLAHPQHIASLSTQPGKVVILPDCHHAPQREYPALVLDAVRQFLQGDKE